MGGFGSGRRDQVGKSTTSGCWSLDVRQIQRAGLLTPGRAFGWNWTRNSEAVASIQVRTEANHVTLKYRHRRNDEWTDKHYPVYLDWTGCNLGGRRAWFLCPASGCGRRVAILYLGRAGIFACRHCYRLAYDSQRKNASDRAMRRADAIRRRLGWGAGIANPPGDKPHGMHWRTYKRLLQQLNVFSSAACVGIMEKFGLMNQRLDGLADDILKK